MTRQEITKHFRKRLKAAGVNAKCKMQDLCGHKMVAIDTPEFEYTFSEEEQNVIANIAEACHLTMIRGLQIINNGTFAHGAKFEFKN